jgi:hypothetical protein
MAAAGKTEENVYAERCMRIIKDEEVDLSEYLDFVDARSHQTLFRGGVHTIPKTFILRWDSLHR